MTMPIIVRRPKLIFQPVDADGEPDGDPVDVSCDMSSVELSVDTPMIDVATFCGKFQVPDDIEEGASLEVTVNEDTDTNWSPLVGKRVVASLYDRQDAARYRRFTTEIHVNPSLYGTASPGEARTVSFDVPVLDSPSWIDVETPPEPEPPE